MRNYKKKMAAYRITKKRYKELRHFCLAAKDDSVIKKTAAESTDDQLAAYIVRHVTSHGYGITAMQADGLPCNPDTFRVYRAKFFYLLDKKVS